MLSDNPLDRVRSAAFVCKHCGTVSWNKPHLGSCKLLKTFQAWSPSGRHVWLVTTPLRPNQLLEGR